MFIEYDDFFVLCFFDVKNDEFSAKSEKHLRSFMIRELCKGVYSVDLGESFPTHPLFLNLLFK